jgi:hypothetical protein
VSLPQRSDEETLLRQCTKFLASLIRKSVRKRDRLRHLVDRYDGGWEQFDVEASWEYSKMVGLARDHVPRRGHSSRITKFLRRVSNCTTWKRIRVASTTSRRNRRRYSNHFASGSSQGIRRKRTTRQVPPPVWNSVKRPRRSFARWVVSNRARYRCAVRRYLKRSVSTAPWRFLWQEEIPSCRFGPSVCTAIQSTLMLRDGFRAPQNGSPLCIV